MAAIDIQFENYGTVMVVQPLTARAWQWAKNNMGFESWQMVGGGIAVEPRAAVDIAAGALQDGLMVA